ncbi:MAG: hypothetical protein FWG43_03950 [Clostridiales bacterium]|nr:hypothetical protein [Clostridiales bacterium]
MKLNHNNSALRICIDTIEHGIISGRVFGQRLAEPLFFSDISDLLLQIDEVLNAQDYPRAFQRKRSFSAVEKTQAPALAELSGHFMDIETVQSAFGAVATHSINIISRQNTSWQGSIDWLDETAPTNFKSALEYIRIVNNELRNCK